MSPHPFTIYEWEYVSVIENTANRKRLSRAWSMVIDMKRAKELVAFLNFMEDRDIYLNETRGRSAFALRDEEGRLVIHLGEDLSVGLIFHEYAHCILFNKNIGHSHGPLFTTTLDMLLHKYEWEWML